jgi:hypothetical protein
VRGWESGSDMGAIWARSRSVCLCRRQAIANAEAELTLFRNSGWVDEWKLWEIESVEKDG